MAGQGQFQAGTAAIPATQVQISVSCRGLRDCDTFSKSDPICVLFTKDVKTNQFYEHGRTEMIKDNLNPDFVKKFVINYFFEESQKLKFEIYDVDSSSARLSDHDFLGRMECTLGEVVGAPNGTFDRPLQGPVKNNGKIMLRAEEMSNCKEIAHMQFKATGLDKKDFFGKSDPYLEFSRVNEDGSFTVVHRTEVIKNTLNPTWAPFRVHVRSLCNGDHDRSIRIMCYDWNSDGSKDLIGEVTTNLRELTRGPGLTNQYEVINTQKKAKKKKYKNSGEVILMSCRIEVEHTFLDYITSGNSIRVSNSLDPEEMPIIGVSSGSKLFAYGIMISPLAPKELKTEMAFTVAVDFTASNGNPSSPSSLHYISPYGGPNQYASAIRAVGDIVQDYDSDKMFPALGFGARFPDGSVQHEFSLNFNAQNPYCHQIEGVLGAYYNAIKSVQLYGPTNFAPCINHVARFASAVRDGSCYFVLLIITDGVITDMPQTKQAIVNAASLPMSIIIVGVGDADFENMNVLDGDDVRLSYQGRYAQRDIVQFVPYRDFLTNTHQEQAMQLSQIALAKEVLAEVPAQFVPFRDFVGAHQGQNMSICQSALAKEVLAEIPEQVISYMRANNIMPKSNPNAPPPPYS